MKIEGRKGKFPDHDQIYNIVSKSCWNFVNMRKFNLDLTKQYLADVPFLVLEMDLAIFERKLPHMTE